MWQPDGWARTRIGVLTPHADVWPEAEFGAMAPDGISIHAARVPFGAYKPNGTMDRVIADDPVRAFADPPRIDDAAELLARPPCMRSPTASPAAATCAVPAMMPS
jgi:maleate isomerase